MKLKTGEQSILASFSSSTKAELAKNNLFKAGITEVQIDRVGRYGFKPNREFNNPVAGLAYTQTGLSLFSASEQLDDDTRILLTSDPAVNGMASEGYGLAGGYGFLLTVVTNESKVEQAVKIIKEAGGEV